MKTRNFIRNAVLAVVVLAPAGALAQFTAAPNGSIPPPPRPGANSGPATPPAEAPSTILPPPIDNDDDAPTCRNAGTDAQLKVLNQQNITVSQQLSALQATASADKTKLAQARNQPDSDAQKKTIAEMTNVVAADDTKLAALNATREHIIENIDELQRLKPCR